MSTRILGIESSCDETAAAVVADGREILSSVVASQIDIHRKYGGVVPELASREHLRQIVPVVREALAQAGMKLADVDAIGVTKGPGLVGALLVGITYGKTLAEALGKPLIPVNHLEGHVHAVFLEAHKAGREVKLPAVCLIVSGGHTVLYEVKPEDLDAQGAGARLHYRKIAQTRDDAAGEAYDKVAKLLGLGYPGGPVIDRLAQGADDRAVEFTVARIKDGKADFSFSGIKTAVLHHVRKNGIAPVSDPARVPDEVKNLVASFQRAVVTALVRRLRRAAEERCPASLILTGGVAANSLLRREAARAAEELGRPLVAPPIALSTDNAAMIAAAGDVAFRKGVRAGWDLNAEPHLPLG